MKIYNESQVMKDDFLMGLKIGYENNDEMFGIKESEKKNDEKIYYVLYDL
jgi:hypothetical protein